VVAAVLCKLYVYEGYLRHSWDYVRSYSSGETQKALKALMALLTEIEKVLLLVLEGPEAVEHVSKRRQGHLPHLVGS